MRRVLFLVVIVLIASVSNVKAQDYKTAAGIKFYPGAVSVKHFIKEKAAIEGLGYFWRYGTRITGLYEHHMDINDIDGLKWYVGGGAHIGFYSSKWGGGSAVGVDGVIGLDYKIKDAPINLSLDWQPSFEFGDRFRNGFGGGWGGLAIRYVFN